MQPHAQPRSPRRAVLTASATSASPSQVVAGNGDQLSSLPTSAVGWRTLPGFPIPSFAMNSHVTNFVAQARGRGRARPARRRASHAPRHSNRTRHGVRCVGRHRFPRAGPEHDLGGGLHARQLERNQPGRPAQVHEERRRRVEPRGVRETLRGGGGGGCLRGVSAWLPARRVPARHLSHRVSRAPLRTAASTCA